MPVFHVEMRWRCAACQSENLGRFKLCQTCSKPKGQEAFYDAGTNAQAHPDQAVADPRLVALAAAGADWECRYCRTKQPRHRTRCDNCGAPEREADEPAATAPRAFVASALVAELEDETAFHAALRRKRGRIWAIALAGAAALGALVFFGSYVREPSRLTSLPGSGSTRH